MNLQTITSPYGGVVLYKGELVACFSGKNGKRKAESFTLLAQVGRTRESKRVACLTMLTFRDAERAIDIYRERNGDE